MNWILGLGLRFGRLVVAVAIGLTVIGIAQLRSAGIEVKDPESDPNGRFTRIHDPEGNPIELWQPA